jgi:hypothetical protein
MGYGEQESLHAVEDPETKEVDEDACCGKQLASERHKLTQVDMCAAEERPTYSEGKESQKCDGMGAQSPAQVASTALQRLRGLHSIRIHFSIICEVCRPSRCPCRARASL